MEHPAIHVLGIAPYEGMKTAMEHAAEAYPNVQLEVYTGDLEAGAAIVRNAQANAYDCIISRGGTAELIRGVTDIPVVEIQLSVYDVLRAIKLAENYSNLYAIVGFPSITEPAHTLCDLLRYNLDILTVHSTEEVTNTLTRLKQGGYRMVVSDMVTHTIARQMGLDAFLITSGVESLHTAFDQALALSAGFRRLRQENLFLRSISQAENGSTIVLDEMGTLYYSTPTKPGPGLLATLRAKMTEMAVGTPLKFYYNEEGTLYTIVAQRVAMGRSRYDLFHAQPAQIPLRANRSGIRALSKSECEHLMNNSFYSISGAMGELETTLTSIAGTRQPVMIVGEDGTGKEQIARALYLRSQLCNRPFVMVDCVLMNDKGWDYLLNHYSSPLNDSGCTIYFQHLEALPEARCPELLSVILETGLVKRERLIFSCVCQAEQPLPETGRLFASRLGCLSLQLPTLRSRADEIPSLASLYLGSLNLELGKQITGFDSQAVDQLCHYRWPYNYTQFKQVLCELATLTSSSYIRSSLVVELLTKENTLIRGRALQTADAPDETRTLEQITYDAVCRALAAHGGNQSAAAKQLGISRTTMWRYLNSTVGTVQKKN
jgi:transcriptional regulator with PAS, ATPase and Fis domain